MPHPDSRLGAARLADGERAVLGFPHGENTLLHTTWEVLVRGATGFAGDCDATVPRCANDQRRPAHDHEDLL